MDAAAVRAAVNAQRMMIETLFDQLRRDGLDTPGVTRDPYGAGEQRVHATIARVAETLGLEIARVHQPDLVMLDLHLPDGSGFDVLAAMKRDKRLSGIPVVVLSADASPNQARRLLAAGAKNYLTKPLDLDEVLNLLDDIAAAPSGVARSPDPLS